jgi:Ca-activated chloride channel family protein
MTRASFRSLPALLAGGLLLLAAPLQAGPIFVPGQLEGKKFTPAPGVPCHCYTIRFSTATVSVEKDAARVEIEEVIDGPDKTVPALCLIPLPDGVNGGSIRVSWGKVGSEPKLLGDATFLDAAKAQAMYETLARGGLTKILAFTGRPAILVPTINLGGKGKMSITFGMDVKNRQGMHVLTCPMPAASYSAAPVERVTVNVHLTNKHPLRSIFSPTHTTTVTRKSPTEATATVKADRWTGLDDFRLFWAADTDALGLRVLAYRASDKEDGYFMLLGNPAGAAARRAVLKDVTFVMDTSGSMRGEKIEQARAALDYCIQHLDRTDRFNIVTFATDVKTFKNDLVDATPQNVKAARAFIEDVVAHGQTNIAGALQKALAGKAAAGRERIMIFVTDGAPTVGERSPAKILEQVKEQNAGTRIFVMGVGNDVNAHLLDQLAELTDGSSEYVAPKEELDAKVAVLYDRLSHPVLSGVKVAFGDSGARQVLPSKVPVLFKGSEIMMVGRYKHSGKHTFTISGTLAGKSVEYMCAANLPKGAVESSNEFLAPLWAARQIGYLLQEIRLRGAAKELIEEVVRLSKQYGIVTEYTEFIASAGPYGFGGGAGYAEAKRRLTMARGEQAGKWAVNQALNDRQLQTRTVAGAAANTFRDRRGRETSYSNINLVGKRAFYLQNGQWVDAEEAGKRKTRVIKILSPEYFELLKKDATFARAQQLGWALSINIGEERIVVEKDGKQKDETLIPKGVDPAPLQGPGGGLKQRRGPGLEQKQLQDRRLRNLLDRPNGGPNLRQIPPLQQQLPGNGKLLNRDQ